MDKTATSTGDSSTDVVRKRTHTRDPLTDAVRKRRRIIITINTLLRERLGLEPDTRLETPKPASTPEVVEFLQNIVGGKCAFEAAELGK